MPQSLAEYSLFYRALLQKRPICGDCSFATVSLFHKGACYWILTLQDTIVNNTLQHAATHCNTLQHTVTHCNIPQHTVTRKWCAHMSDCNALQHTATHCTTLQHTATHRNTRVMRPYSQTATHCNALQHTATHCTTLQHTVLAHLSATRG